MGNVHHCDDHSDRAADGGLSQADSSGKGAGSVGPRIRACVTGDLGRAVGGAQPRTGANLHLPRADSGYSDFDLCVCRLCDARMVAAGAARLPEHLCETGNDWAAGDWHRGAASYAAHASLHALCGRDRARIRRKDFSVRLHHHCVRGDQRISCSDLERDDAEANRARDADSHGGLWRDDGRVGGSGDGNHRGLRVAAGNLFCNQQSGGNCWAESGRGDRDDF